MNLANKSLFSLHSCTVYSVHSSVYKLFSITQEMLVEHLNLSRLSMPHFSEIASLKGLQTLEIDGLDAPGREIIQGLTNLNSSKLKDLQARFLGVPCQVAKITFSEQP